MLLPMTRKRSFPYLFALSVLIIVAVGALSSQYVYEKVDASGRAHILDRANTVASLLPPEDIRALTASDFDIGTPAYEHLKQLLIDVRKVNSDVRFLYLMGKQDDVVFFYADSEPASSEDYSPPGQAYDEATDAMHLIFNDGLARAEGPDRDRWGTWISAYAPVFDEQGKVIALLGIDLPAEDFLRDLYVYSLLPGIITLSILLFLIAGELARRREQKIVDEKEEFLSIASHEIRTPLTGVRWGLEQLLRKEAGVAEHDRATLTLMHETAVTLVARLNNLLDARSLEHQAEREFKKDTIYVEAFMREAASTLMLAAKERGLTIILPQAGDASIQADSQLLRHVFQNLIGNAIKYTKPNTTVTVSYVKEGDMDVFRFKDEGEGIPQEERATIFSGYKRGQSARKGSEHGTGLGLYMARKAVLMHGGTITVESETGKGTVITVRIPQ